MHSTSVAGHLEVDPHSITGVLESQGALFLKLGRLRAVKQQLADLRAEHDQLERELFGSPRPEAQERRT
jgi:hypothetical protein